MLEKVKAALDEIRPALGADGGDIELIEVTKDGIVRVRLRGTCAGCPMAAMTMAMGAESVLKERIPHVKRVEAI